MNGLKLAAILSPLKQASQYQIKALIGAILRILLKSFSKLKMRDLT